MQQIDQALVKAQEQIRLVKTTNPDAAETADEPKKEVEEKHRAAMEYINTKYKSSLDALKNRVSDAKCLSALESVSADILEATKQLNKQESAEWTDVTKKITMNFGVLSRKRGASITQAR